MVHAESTSKRSLVKEAHEQYGLMDVGTAGPIKGQLAVYGVSGEPKGTPVPSQALKTRIWASYRCYRSVEATKCHETFFFLVAVRGVVCAESTQAALLRDSRGYGPYSSAK